MIRELKQSLEHLIKCRIRETIKKNQMEIMELKSTIQIEKFTIKI